MKSIVTVAFVGVVGVGALLVFGPDRSTNEESVNAESRIAAAIERLEERQAAGEELTEDELKLTLDEIDAMVAEMEEDDYPPHVLQDQEQWQRERGWYQDPNDPLKYYPTANNRANVERMAAEGDINALVELAKGMPDDERNAMLKEAAILGSVRALHEAAGIAGMRATSQTAQQRESVDSEYDQQMAAIERLEYLFTAELRGDSLAGPSSVRQAVSTWSYTDDDIAQACAQAQYRYNELEAERMSRGLPAFDNSTAPLSTEPMRSETLCNFSD